MYERSESALTGVGASVAEVDAGGPLRINVQEHGLMVSILGEKDEHLRLVESAFRDSQIVVRGNEISISGAERELIGLLFGELALLAERGDRIETSTIVHSIAMLRESTSPLKVTNLELAKTRLGKPIRPKTNGQRRYVEAIAVNTITFGIGPAGTGKSYLAVALAVAALQEKRVNRIILTRPAVEAGERLGFLPGDLSAKVDPFLRPLYDALYDLMEAELVAKLFERQVIEVAPLAFMRGRTLNSSFIILDEAQNTTLGQMKMFLTRIGFGSKVVVTGDVTQIDLTAGRSGLLDVERTLGGVDGIGFVRLHARDVVRNPIVTAIVEAYEESERKESIS
ncbi:MAG: PhoH family protein [Ferrimicrobium sp.]